MANHDPFDNSANGPLQIRINSDQCSPCDDNQLSTCTPVSRYGLRRTLTPGSPASPSFGSIPTAADSSDHLIPPQPRRLRHIYNFATGTSSPVQSAASSRRNSLSSEGTVDSGVYRYLPSSLDNSRAPSRASSGDNDVNTHTVAEKYNIMPSEGLLLFPEDVERDDYLHNPDLNDRERDCDVFNRRGMVNLGGLVLFCLGFLILFIGYPVLTFVSKTENGKANERCSDDPLCLDVGERPLLQNIRRGLIDPDTPDSAKQIKSADGKMWKLVFSDEFNTNGRTFYEEDDPYYQAMDFWYGVTHDLEWYDPDAATTKDGVLELQLDQFRNHNLTYRSGMVQSWNKLCFSGGRLEASISLPGRGDTSGFWPGFWAMGNLGRPGYAATTDGMWPYSYHDKCDAGITPNQSSTDGINWLPGMRLPACTCDDTLHPTPGKSRSAPELDVIEASVGPLNGNKNAIIGTVSQSLQIAPFDVWYMPDYDFTAVYNDRITEINDYRGGTYQQAMSGMSNLNNDWYDGKEYQVYAFEYTPGATGDVTWFVGEDKTWTLDGRAIGPNGNIGQRVIPMEPMAVIMNLGISESFAPINASIKNLMPGKMRFDYMRIYQDPDHVSVTCDPPGYETTEYIKKHPKAYQNANMTFWRDAGYDWPGNTFMGTC